MSKSLTEMAAEILAARVRHEAMTSKQIESCLDDTFEALRKLKEREDATLENAVQPIIKSEKPPQAKQEELEKPVAQEPIKKSEEPQLKPEEPSKPAVQPKKDTIVGTILSLIKSKPKGVDAKYIMEQTGFKKNQVWATVYRAKRNGQVKTTKRGIYVSVKSRKRK